MYKRFKRALLHLAKLVGGFRVALWLTKRELRIVCFHGVSQRDEHLWHPALFIRPESLASRMSILQRYGFPVLTLEKAVALLPLGALPRHSVVITFDDGFYNNYLLAMPILRKFGYPATLYASSYYIVHQHPEFRSTLLYILWAATKGNGSKTLDLRTITEGSVGEVIDLAQSASFDRAQRLLFSFGQSLESDAARLELLQRLGTALDVDVKSIIDARLFHYVTPSELQEMEKNGWRAEFHTHCHTVKASCSRLAEEIEENKIALQPIIGRVPRHFCYPSGIWCEDLWGVLSTAQVKSATTCQPGLNSSCTPLYALYRFLDAENNADIEFEAEITGFSEVLRRALRRLKKREEKHPSKDGDVSLEWRGAA